ncbi:hypothetical protein PsorP6_010462 [Peronosclerospora sorghi]|uniref:Uncharacterized protein n=1 Tax=Peronosclerospora sorghi TaxID=230839 RepID=A0ACC0VY46_9STRA|nr:hypothetical protein PsorP6_010462 [Peronosclerospora sorghi]
MGGRRKGGQKKGTRKRKANLWDDAEVTSQRRASTCENDDTRQKKRTRGSMMGQWKAQKMAQRTKERRLVDSIESTKRQQREQYEATWERKVDALYKRNDEEHSENEVVEEKDEDEKQESESDGENLVLEGNKESAVFAEFVKTFTVEEASDEEAVESEDENVGVVEQEEDGGEEQETDHEEEDREAKEEADRESAKQLAAMERDDEEQVDEHDDENEQEDPFRRRYLLSSFSENDAKTFDAEPRKFSSLQLPFDEHEKYHVTYRPGMVATDVAGLAGVVTPPEVAIKMKPCVRARLLTTWRQRGFDLETAFPTRSMERTLLQHMLAYVDVFFAGQTHANTSTLRQIGALHVLNHILKARDTMTRHNDRIKRQADAPEPQAREYRDQGFCRPRVLVLLPLRSAALDFMTHLLALLPSRITTFYNKERFFRDFGSPDDTEASTERPAWQRVVRDGNPDDCFQLGISFARTSMRFFSDYDHADLILASPLGLRHELGDHVAVLDDRAAPLPCVFLSSIEVCLVDSATLMLMQNLEHVRSVLRATNRAPASAPSADFGRIRDWNLSFLAAYFRQTIVWAHGMEPSLHALVSATCRNVSGCVKYTRRYAQTDGTAAIAHVVPCVRQVFQRVDVAPATIRLSAVEEHHRRFRYFKEHVFEPLVAQPRKHVLLVIPSYFDYVRVRNLFQETMTRKVIQSVACCEYTKPRAISRARTAFFHGQCHVMLYTERFHLYHQYHIRGVHQIIWYNVPVIEDFYTEVLNFLPSGGERPDGQAPTSIALFSRLDLLRMQRIVGNRHGHCFDTTGSSDRARVGSFNAATPTNGYVFDEEDRLGPVSGKNGH